MREKKYHAHVLVIFTLCLCLLLPSATIAADHGETYIKCTAISTDGTLYPGNIEMVGDVNCFSFTATKGNTYVIETSEFSTACDPVINLYSADGTIEIDGNENRSTSLSSKIEWSASSSGIYYVMVENLDSTSGNISYKISVK